MIRSSQGRGQIQEGAVALLACPTHGMGGSGGQKNRRVGTNPDVRFYDENFFAIRSKLRDLALALVSSAVWLRQITDFTTHWHQRHPGIMAAPLCTDPSYANALALRALGSKDNTTIASSQHGQYPFVHRHRSIQTLAIYEGLMREMAASRHQRRTRSIFQRIGMSSYFDGFKCGVLYFQTCSKRIPGNGDRIPKRYPGPSIQESM